MWGNVSSEAKFKSGLRRSRLAPPIVATLAAASVAGALATSARASTPSDPIEIRAASLPRLGIKLKLDPVAAEPTAAMLRSKLDIAGREQMLGRVALKPRASAISGIASMYNPAKPGDRSGGMETASGELYEPEAWAAAIQIDLRSAFGGVRFGRSYRPAYALVTTGEKSAVVKINDVGPLLPGRVIDLTERTMRYFDASLQRGVLAAVNVVPLAGEDWRTGPLEGGPALPMAGDCLSENLH
jgi:rare lipoprotein A